MSKISAIAKLIAATKERQRLSKSWDDKRNNDVVALLATCLPELFNIDRYGLFVVDSNNQKVWLEAGTGVTERSIVVAAENSVVGEAIRNRKVCCYTDLSKHPDSMRVTSQQVGYVPLSVLTAPIYCPVTGDVVGALQVMNGSQEVSWNERDVSLAENVCHCIAGTVKVLHDHQDLIAGIDGLDRQIKLLDSQESALRGGHVLRTFEPAIPLHMGGFLHGRYRGTAFPPFIDIDANADLARTWDTDQYDIFICTHQKVGTHLVKKFIVEILRERLKDRSNIYATGDIGHGTVPWPEVSVSQHGRAYIDEHIAKTHDTPRAWYVHCSYEDMPVRSFHPKSKFVVVFRDPRAVAVSQFYFWKRHPLLSVPDDMMLDDFVRLFIEGDLYFGDYHQHVRGWIDRKDQRIPSQNILALSYEDMVNRKFDVARALARFLAPNVSFSSQTLRNIALSTEFNTMKQEVTANPQSFHLNPKVYFRSGTTNDWEQKLSDIAIAAIDEKTRSRWAGSTHSPLLTDGVTLLDKLT